MTQPTRRVVVAALLSASFASPAFAWGPLGHRAVARIAEERLTPSTKQKLQALLGAPDALERVASCADEILHSRGSVNCGGLITLPSDDAKATHDWHFMNIPVSAKLSAGEVAKYCPNGSDCVWAQIGKQVDAIRAGGSPQQKKVALMYLVHFVGDAHQPLHVADNGDRGGNESPIVFGTIHKSLHQVWDGLIQLREWTSRPKMNPPFDPAEMERLIQGDLEPLMKRLHADLEHADTGSWTSGDMATEAVLEGHAVAHDAIYPSYNATHGNLDASYEDQMQPVAFGRVERAGVRLAALIEQAFAGPGPRALDAKVAGLAVDRALQSSPVQ